MLDQLTRSKSLVRSKLLGRRSEILHHCLLLFTQIGVTNFGSYSFRLDLIQASVDRDARDPVLQRYFSRKLRQFLKYFDKNHLAKVLLSRSTWPMRAHQLRHKRIKLPDQYASRFIIMLERSFNQRACVRIIHVIENASTPLPMTGIGGLRLQFLQLNRENKM